MTAVTDHARKPLAEQAQAEMPRYECHKTVWALRIKALSGDVELRQDHGALLIPEDGRYAAFPVTSEWLDRNRRAAAINPENPHGDLVGGYYVVYEDGYTSWSPAAAFEKGYTRIN